MHNLSEDLCEVAAIKSRHAALGDASHSFKVAKIGGSTKLPSQVLPTTLSIEVPKTCLRNRSINTEKVEERFKPGLFSSMVAATEGGRRPSLISQKARPAATHLMTPSPVTSSPRTSPEFHITSLDICSYPSSSGKSAINVWPGHWHPETFRVAKKAQQGLVAGKRPILAEGCLSGSYILRAPSRRLCAVFKPTDEEPSGPHNPWDQLRAPVKGSIAAGGGAVRECIAWLLDKENRASVPPTCMATAISPFFNGEHPKHGSLQVYMRHECSAEDVGPSLFPLHDVQEIAILDIRLLNQDRHSGNVLVSEGINSEPCLTSMEVLLSGSFCSASDESCNLSFKSTKDGSWISETMTSNGDESMSEFESSFLSPTSALSSTGCSSTAILSSLTFGAGRKPLRSRRFISSIGDDVIQHSDTDDGIKLIPIDHGFCLPHPRSMSDTDLAWLQWPQSHAPLDESQRSYIASLDAEQDIKHIKKVLGNLAPSEEYLMSIFIGTTLLKKGVEKGLSLHSIGRLMTRNGDPDKPSKLECAVEMAATANKKVDANCSPSISTHGDALCKHSLDAAITTIVHEACVHSELCN